jgi:hypothetical protein
MKKNENNFFIDLQENENDKNDINVFRSKTKL